MPTTEEFIQSRPVLKKFFSTKEGKIIIGQNPNLPMIGFVVLKAVSLLLTGTLGRYLGFLGDFSLLVWAIMELFAGVNIFRRSLGLITLLALAFFAYFAPWLF